MLDRLFNREPNGLARREPSSPVRCSRGKPGEVIYDRDEIFDWIVAFKTAHDGNSPTLAELMQQFQISSKSVVTYILNNLEDAGLIRRTGYKARLICVSGGRWSRDDSCSKGSQG